MQWKASCFWCRKDLERSKQELVLLEALYITHEVASPTVSHVVTIIIGVIESNQRCDIMTIEIPNAFVMTDIDQPGEKIIMKIRGELEDIPVETSP